MVLTASSPSNGGLFSFVDPILKRLGESDIGWAIAEAFAAEKESVASIESLFAWMADALFFHSWKVTHLKMLAIYGLSCRLQRLAVQHGAGFERDCLMLAAVHNAATSYEDLGLDYEGLTHAELYDQLVANFLPDDQWVRSRWCLAPAKLFQEWVYKNMVVQPELTGLLTNLFSEIYNHAEYSIAQRSFAQRLERQGEMPRSQQKKALCYIDVHVSDATEEEHFEVVLEAIQLYSKATSIAVDRLQALSIFREYLCKIGLIMEMLEKNGREMSCNREIACVHS
jgi:hypothetical protein